jgi:predicted enzyme related to lactoylglutathione lyase
VTIDADDPQAIARFWSEAIGWRLTFDDPQESVLEPPVGDPAAGGPDILFVKVPDRKAVKNRLHFDLRPMDQEAEVTRLLALGATRADIGQGDEVPWVVLADPEGNEFCVLRPSPEPE